MNIINKTQGAIYFNSSFPGAGDCGTISQEENLYIPYQKEDGQVTIRLGSTKESYQSLDVKGGDTVVVTMEVIRASK